MIDLNNEEEQRSRNYGPVPSGSIVFIKMALEKPRYPAPEVHEFVSISKGGFLGLWVKFEVAEGTYAACSWYENLWLPQGHQNVSLSDGQVKACNMSGSRIRAITEASRGVSAKDTSAQAARKRQLGDWLDLNGMEFPARVGIAKESYEKDGKTYWNNTIAQVITPDRKEYAEVRQLGEIITNGPTTGEGNGNGKRGGARSDDGDYDRPPVDVYEYDQPF
jgi:hypothetical protein